MAWVTQTKGETTFGSVVRYKGLKYIFLHNELVALTYYTFQVVPEKELGVDSDTYWEVWKDENIFKQLKIPNHNEYDTCALGILDNLSET